MSESEFEIMQRRVAENKLRLVIDRVPAKTKNDFMDFADSDFCSDYGMCLKFLLDFYTGSLPNGNEATLMKLSELEERLNKIESGSDKIIKTVTGKIIRRG